MKMRPPKAIIELPIIELPIVELPSVKGSVLSLSLSISLYLSLHPVLLAKAGSHRCFVEAAHGGEARIAEIIVSKLTIGLFA